MEKGVVFKNICKKHGAATALSDVSFSIKKGEFFSILGPSGCGKTTLLRLLAGFDHPDSGQIFLDGVDITALPPNKRPINTVFQNYALFPHLTIWENIAFGLRIAKHPEPFIQKEVERMLQLIQMPEHAHKKPEQISGGQKQRVAIARALINHPQVLLLDEPLAALDLKLRQKMLIDLDLIHDEVGITFIFVTHDQTEAMSVSDRIAVLHKGHLEQIGSPVEIYEAPKSHFVADFIGDTNFFDGRVYHPLVENSHFDSARQSQIEALRSERGSPSQIGKGNEEDQFGKAAASQNAKFQLEDGISQTIENQYSLLTLSEFPDIVCFNDKKLSPNELVHLSVRPEKIHISRQKPPENPLMNCFEGFVDEMIYKGDHTYFGIKVANRKISLTKQHRHFLLDEKTFQWNEPVWIWWHADDGFILERVMHGKV